MQVYNDELYHYGKKGMKWGQRIKRRYDATNKMGLDQITHPIHSTKAQLDMIKKNPRKALFMTTKDVEKLNADVKNRVDRSNASIKEKVQNYKKSFDEASKYGDVNWKKTKALYKQTGSNAVSRIINNLKY